MSMSKLMPEQGLVAIKQTQFIKRHEEKEIVASHDRQRPEGKHHGGEETTTQYRHNIYTHNSSDDN